MRGKGDDPPWSELSAAKAAREVGKVVGKRRGLRVDFRCRPSRQLGGLFFDIGPCHHHPINDKLVALEILQSLIESLHQSHCCDNKSGTG